MPFPSKVNVHDFRKVHWLVPRLFIQHLAASPLLGNWKRWHLHKLTCTSWPLISPQQVVRWYLSVFTCYRVCTVFVFLCRYKIMNYNYGPGNDRSCTFNPVIDLKCHTLWVFVCFGGCLTLRCWNGAGLLWCDAWTLWCVNHQRRLTDLNVRERNGSWSYLFWQIKNYVCRWLQIYF